MTGWKSARLGDLCKIAIGKTPSRGVSRYWDKDRETDNVWLSIADLTQSRNFHINDSKEYVSDEAARSSKPVKAGTLLMSFKLSIGKIAVAGRDLFTNEAIAALTILDSNLISRDYLQYFLFGYNWDAATAGDHKVKGKTLNKAKLKELIISFPPLPEQRRIVGILDKAFEGVAKAKAKAERNLANAKELFQSELTAIFSENSDWNETKIGSCVKFIDYRGKTPVKTASGLRLITAKNVKMGYLQENPKEYVSPESYDSWMTRGIPKQGDVLFTTEAPLANVAQLDTDERVVFAQRIIIMQPDARILSSNFLKYLLLSSPIQRKILEKGTGATVTGIKASLLKTVEIAYPNTLEAQQEIVERLDELQGFSKSLSDQYVRKIEMMDSLKSSLLHQAFSGNL